MDQQTSILLRTDTFNGPPSKIQLNPKLFWGLHKTDTPPRKGCDDPASTDDSTFAPSPVPSPVDPYLNSHPPLDMGLIAHLQVELRVL